MRLWLKVLLVLCPLSLQALPFYWWEPANGTQNFGDHLSAVLVERILGRPIQKAAIKEHKILGIGSILHFAREGDVVWGSGINGKHPLPYDYHFKTLDVRAVRGPLTRMMLRSLGVKAPEIYGDPALLFAQFFPEYECVPTREYLVVVHLSEEHLFPKHSNVIYCSEPWQTVVKAITQSEFVISTSLHGLVIAESFGIPARLLRKTENEPLFKFADYYLGTGRAGFKYATSISEALEMGGEPLPVCDLTKLLEVFPYELFN